MIDTPARRLWERDPSRFSSTPTGVSGGALGFPNMANTAPLPWGDRLFATWDVGRPVELDPRDHSFIAEVGSAESWGPQSIPMPGLMPFYFSTAHPVIDPERNCMWTVKLTASAEPDTDGSMTMDVSLVRYSGRGKAVEVWPIDGAKVRGSSHTVSQTRHWIIVADSGNFKADLGEIMGGERTVTIDDSAAVYLIRKSSVDRTQPGATLPCTRTEIAPTTGHFYGTWDDYDGVEVIFEHMDRVDLGLSLRADDLDANGNPIDPSLAGFYNMAMGPSTVSEVRFDPLTGEATHRARFSDPTWTWNLQLSSMDWSLAGLIQPKMHHVVYQGCRPEAVSQRALNLYGERIGTPPAVESPAVLASLRRGSLEVHATYEFPQNSDLPTSPTFVRGGRPGGHEGHIIVPVLSDSGLRIEVFNAADVGRGPVATLASPKKQTVPLLLHSAWIPAHPTRNVGARALASPRRDEATLTFQDDYPQSVIEALDPEVRAHVEAVAASFASDTSA